VLPPDVLKIECSAVAYNLVSETTPTAPVACPANCLEAGGTVWGTELYTDDSRICLAAIHAGVIENAVGGAFTLTFRPGQQRYSGTTANGVTTLDYAVWRASFAVSVLTP
jgi:hypothetical protein